MNVESLRIKPLSAIEHKFYDLCKPVVVDQNLYLYDVEYNDKNQLLRLYIENEETQTATLDECAKVDHALTDVIDEADFIGDELVLEVSSPGVFRHLACSDHFSQSVGKRTSILLKQKLSEDFGLGPVKRVIGKVVKAEGESLTLVEENKSKEVTLVLDMIKKANVEPHWDEIKEN